MTPDEIAALMAMAARWEQPTPPTSDDPTWDHAVDAARSACANELRDYLEEHADD